VTYAIKYIIYGREHTPPLAASIVSAVEHWGWRPKIGFRRLACRACRRTEADVHQGEEALGVCVLPLHTSSTDAGLR
jgi:hypothetical protein